jgi:hypothetical protein
MPVKKYQLICAFLPAFLFALYTSASTPSLNINRSRLKAKEALKFSKAKGYSTQYCILIDMSLPSGVKRLVVWDFKGDSILLTGMVSHGCGKWPWGADWSKNNPGFSNADGSHATALGKYKLSGRAYSNWSIHVKYYMYGLESSNNKALGRQIVFHSWDKVPDKDVYPNGTPEGWGCPAISNNTMKVIDKLLHKQKKAWLMWIYN